MFTVSLQWSFYQPPLKSIFVRDLVEEPGQVLALDNPDVEFSENLLNHLRDMKPGCFDSVSWTRVEIKKQGSFRLFFESDGVEYEVGFRKGGTQFTGEWPPAFNELAFFYSPELTVDRKKGPPTDCEFSDDESGNWVAVIHNPTRP